MRYADSLANNTRRTKPDEQQGKNEQDTVTRSGMLAKRKIKVSIGLTMDSKVRNPSEGWTKR